MRVSSALIVVLLAGSGCSRNLYELPNLPEKASWRHAELDPVSAQQANFQAFMVAKQTLVALYAALDARRWDDASTLLTLETRTLLGSGDPTRAAAGLAAGQLTVRGVGLAYDPTQFLLLPSLSRMLDDLDGQVLAAGAVDLGDDADEATRSDYATQHESDRRKEVFLVTGDGHYRKVVLLFEDNVWKLHMRDVPLQLVHAADP